MVFVQLTQSGAHRRIFEIVDVEARPEAADAGAR